MQFKSVEEYSREILELYEKRTLKDTPKSVEQENLPKVIVAPAVVEVFQQNSLPIVEKITANNDDSAIDMADKENEAGQKRGLEYKKAKEQESLEDDDYEMGMLLVSVTSNRGAIPVEGATVVVSTTDDNGGIEIDSSITDQSGKTKIFMLPAPSAELSRHTQEKGEDSVFSRYNITVSASGYVTTLIKNLAIFSNTTALKNVDMIFSSVADGGSVRTIDMEEKYEL